MWLWLPVILLIGWLLWPVIFLQRYFSRRSRSRLRALPHHDVAEVRWTEAGVIASSRNPALAIVTLDPKTIERLCWTEFEDHYGGFHNTSEEWALTFTLRDGTTMTLLLADHSSAPGTYDLLEKLCTELRDRGVPVARRRRDVSRSSLMNFFLGGAWVLVMWVLLLMLLARLGL